MLFIGLLPSELGACADTVSVAATDSDATNSAPSSATATVTVTAPSSAPSVVIGYDSRIKSDFFARVAASVFAANGITVHLWSSLTPVPTVSYAVRALHASAGIMITAPHNPAKYNGYKVYGSDGCQITTETARDIQEQIKTVDIFNGVKTMDFDEAIKSGAIQYIDNPVLDSFLAEVKRLIISVHQVTSSVLCEAVRPFQIEQV